MTAKGVSLCCPEVREKMNVLATVNSVEKDGVDTQCVETGAIKNLKELCCLSK